MKLDELFESKEPDITDWDGDIPDKKPDWEIGLDDDVAETAGSSLLGYYIDGKTVIVVDGEAENAEPYSYNQKVTAKQAKRWYEKSIRADGNDEGY